MSMADLDAGRCVLCERRSRLISRTLGLCLGCIRTDAERALDHARAVHQRVRQRLGQTPRPPDDPQGVTCPLCARACRIPDGGLGFCGLRSGKNGRLRQLAGCAAGGLLHSYRDPLPTNCVADFFCPGHGHAKEGRHNLAVFYGACTLNCLFCQNWGFRRMDPGSDTDYRCSAETLAGRTNDETFCVCYFGGDPAAQLPHALAASRRLARRGVAVCWETNGTGNPRLMRRAVELSARSGGVIKFDLKAHDPVLYQALTSGDNRQVLENFCSAADLLLADGEVRLCAATLLVPGYVDVVEVERVARFIAGVDPRIPYTLLAFHPEFMMLDLPLTSWAHAEAAERAARAVGLRNVRVGNLHLLSRAYALDEPW